MKPMLTKSMLTTLALGMSLAFGMRAWAEAPHTGHDHLEATKQVAGAAELSEGQVKKVDQALGKLTLRHGPLENLGMQGMTMVFRVQDSSWLDRVKAGDNVRFLAEKVNGALVITRLEVVTP